MCVSTSSPSFNGIDTFLKCSRFPVRVHMSLASPNLRGNPLIPFLLDLKNIYFWHIEFFRFRYVTFDWQLSLSLRFESFESVAELSRRCLVDHKLSHCLVNTPVILLLFRLATVSFFFECTGQSLLLSVRAGLSRF